MRINNRQIACGPGKAGHGFNLDELTSVERAVGDGVDVFQGNLQTGDNNGYLIGWP